MGQSSAVDQGCLNPLNCLVPVCLFVLGLSMGCGPGILAPFPSESFTYCVTGCSPRGDSASASSRQGQGPPKVSRCTKGLLFLQGGDSGWIQVHICTFLSVEAPDLPRAKYAWGVQVSSAKRPLCPPLYAQEPQTPRQRVGT